MLIFELEGFGLGFRLGWLGGRFENRLRFWNYFRFRHFRREREKMKNERSSGATKWSLGNFRKLGQ